MAARSATIKQVKITPAVGTALTYGMGVLGGETMIEQAHPTEAMAAGYDLETQSMYRFRVAIKNAARTTTVKSIFLGETGQAGDPDTALTTWIEVGLGDGTGSLTVTARAGQASDYLPLYRGSTTEVILNALDLTATDDALATISGGGTSKRYSLDIALLKTSGLYLHLKGMTVDARLNPTSGPDRLQTYRLRGLSTDYDLDDVGLGDALYTAHDAIQKSLVRPAIEFTFLDGTVVTLDAAGYVATPIYSFANGAVNEGLLLEGAGFGDSVLTVSPTL